MRQADILPELPTPAMIEAGANAISPLDRGLIGSYEIAGMIWFEMFRVHR